MTGSEEWNERRHRHSVELEAEVRYVGGHSSKAMVSDLSLEGCRIKGWFRIGEPLELTIPGIGMVRGQVRWAIGGEAGIRFRPGSHPDGDFDGAEDQSAFS